MEADFASPQHEWWFRPPDGRLVPLVLQTNDEPHLLPETPQWTRIGNITSRVSPILRISYWIGSSIFIPGTRDYHISVQSVALAAMKLLVTWPLLCILTFWTGYHGLIGANAQNVGAIDSMKRYDPVYVEQIAGQTQSTHSTSAHSEAHSEIGPREQYQDSIRLTEASTTSAVLGVSSHSARVDDDNIHASVRPRYLCFVKDFEAGTYETVKVSDYLKQNGDDTDLEFVFVSYTRMQFRVSTEEEILKFPYPDEATREANRELARRDRAILARWGMEAANNVGKRAFWLDFECVRNDDGIARSTSNSEDVYRICDIVRAAHSMIIAIGPTANDKLASILAGEESPPYSRKYVTPWLRQWGSRLWTLPELLLCPGEYRIRLYVVGDPSEPKAMAKRNFAERAWDDAEAVKELVNHFEGSAILNSQHLIEAALNCFSRRQTDQFSQGDIAYATMGLFPNRHRPRVNKYDTGFEAFAKLSLANDSGAFLERLICLAPKPGAPWHQTEDRWGVKLSEIHPNNKVYGILALDTILLDGVSGASIQWDELRPEPVIDYGSEKFPKLYIWIAFVLCLLIPVECGILVYFSPLPIILGCVLSLMAIMAVLTPVVLITSRETPRVSIRPRLIGIEGMVDIGTVEKHLWGFNHGSLVDMTPSSYRDIDETHASSSPSLTPGENEHSFTLVDTSLMTVTHIRCGVPPTAMLIFGSEVGIQRAVLCSYDWRTQTFHRQTVLRSTCLGIDKMHQADRIRFSLASHPKPNRSVNSGVPLGRLPSMMMPAGELISNRGWRTWKTEFLFLAMCLFTLDLGGPFISSSRYFDLGFQRPLLPCLTWVMSQSLGVGLLSCLPLSQVFPAVLVAKLFLPILLATLDARILAYVLHGLVDGVFTLTLIAHTLCWYQIEEVALRFLFWSLVSPKCFQLLASSHLRFISMSGSLVQIIIFFLVQLGGESDGLFGCPMEVSWLSAEQKIMYSRMAAAQGLFTKPGGALWRQRQWSLVRYAQPSVVFIVSMLYTISTGLVSINLGESGPTTVRGTLVLLLLAVLVGLVSCRFPSTTLFMMITFAMATSILQIFELFGQHVGNDFPVLIQSNATVPPLLWSVVAHQAATGLEATRTIALAISGQAAAYTLLFYTKQSETQSWGLAVYISVLLGQITFWALLWACGRLSTRRVNLSRNEQPANTAELS